jgi:branched-subunit amino acid transport protein|tara:strand:- start:740 stop:1111 length:372 start_codon:yes stop_codon:yes gene_type:complete
MTPDLPSGWQLGELSVYGLMIVGALVTYFWRALGVALSGRLDVQSPLFEWIACVAYALLAGLIARMVVLPIGALQQTPTLDRLAAALLALVIFFLTRRNLLAGVGSGFGLLVLFIWGRSVFGI